MITKLFALPLQGAGTVDVESLTSYMMRLARAHGLSVRQLLRYLDLWENARRGKSGQRSNLAASGFSTCLVAPSRITAALLGILQYASPIEGLRSATLHALSTEGRRMKLYARAYLRWCPRCMQEWASNGSVAYFKLAWSFYDVDYCHHHLVRLVNTCTKCGSVQHWLNSAKCLSRCSACGTSLARPVRKSHVISASERTAGDIFHLVEQIALEPDIQFRRDGVLQIIQKLEKQVNDSEDARTVFNAIVLAFRPRLSKPWRALQFREIRAFSAMTGISLCDVLKGNCVGQTRAISYAWDLGSTNLWKLEKRKRQNYEAKKNALMGLLARTEGTYPSLKSIAKSLNVSVGYLRYRFKTQAMRIVSDRQQHMRREAERKRRIARLAAIQYFARKNTNGSTKSRKGALRELRMSTGLSKGLLRVQIAEIFTLLQLKPRATHISVVYGKKAKNVPATI